MATSTLVFIPDEEHVWLAAEILVEANEQGLVEVQVHDEAVHEFSSRLVSLKKWGLQALPYQNLEIADAGVDDMCSLNFLHEPSILDNLKRSHSSIQIYIYIRNEDCFPPPPFQAFSKQATLHLYWRNLYCCESLPMAEHLHSRIEVEFHIAIHSLVFYLFCFLQVGTFQAPSPRITAPRLRNISSCLSRTCNKRKKSVHFGVGREWRREDRDGKNPHGPHCVHRQQARR